MHAVVSRWSLDQVDRGTGVPLGRYRPSYRQKAAPGQLDIAGACREAIQEAGIFPIPQFTPEVAENDEEPEYALPRAAKGAKLMTRMVVAISR
jgi:hypothetical protein